MWSGPPAAALAGEPAQDARLSSGLGPGQEGPLRTDPRSLQPTVNDGQPWAAGDTRWLAGTDGPERQRWGFQDQLPAELRESSDISAGSCDPRACICHCIPEGGLGPVPAGYVNVSDRAVTSQSLDLAPLGSLPRNPRPCVTLS